MNSYNLYDYPEDYDVKELSYMNDYGLVLEWARTCAGPVADLGCGTGRLTLPLAAEGIDVEGIDVSRSMLNLAAKKAAATGLNVPLMEMDLTKLELPRSYGMMYMVGNTFQHVLTNVEQERMLQGVHQHLVESGIFIFGTRIPNLAELSQVDVYEQSYQNQKGQRVTEQHEEIYDSVTQLLTCSTIKITVDPVNGEEISRQNIRLQIRYTFPQEILRLLSMTGFEIIHAYGGWKKEPLTSASPEMVFICRKAD
ncbi:class I SAM-dependent methyltransferase [Paenibacillus sp.]|jgi:SAM-dependent methyltransferase|uniref:class I SAM-dependent DNA methyltransferase n=1 Tax=Paenibacillus sp. TaxID=58172 RepID=UPI00281AD9E7|nr:class I SAM-dependent methyltransferase [Paenibacillus sp.]MDR0270758.1 class I SAM-dependent methyltransferase [Paenibacillus sp.]